MKEWKYAGETMNACANPYGWKGGNWCPMKTKALVEGTWVGKGQWSKCKCGKFIVYGYTS